MITEKEKSDIVQEVIETILNRMPEVIGNLMSQHANINKVKTEFYTKYPEFKNHVPVVASVVEGIEGRDLTANYEQILNEAVPEIRKRLKIISDLDFDNVPSPQDLDTKIKLESSNGVL